MSEDESELYRQEGREEVLEWLKQREIVGYSSKENMYFIWDRFKDLLLVLPWKK